MMLTSELLLLYVYRHLLYYNDDVVDWLLCN